MFQLALPLHIYRGEVWTLYKSKSPKIPHRSRFSSRIRLHRTVRWDLPDCPVTPDCPVASAQFGTQHQVRPLPGTKGFFGISSRLRESLKKLHSNFLSSTPSFVCQTPLALAAPALKKLDLASNSRFFLELLKGCSKNRCFVHPHGVGG